MFCEYCKQEGQKTNACDFCGTNYYTATVTFIYGQTERESYGGEFRLTDKYLIVRSVSKAELTSNVTVGATFGVIGALAASAIKASQKKNYAFYDLNEIEKVIYPYHTSKINKNSAFKFINKDGSDFIFNFNLNGMFSIKAAMNFAEALTKVGVKVDRDLNRKFDKCCEKPFVNQNTFATRVCKSAAEFVKIADNQFVAPPIIELDNESQVSMSSLYESEQENIQNNIFENMHKEDIAQHNEETIINEEVLHSYEQQVIDSPQTTSKKQNIYCIMSLVFGIISVITIGSLILPELLAIIFAIVGRAYTEKTNTEGNGFALAGLIMGLITTFVVLCALLFIVGLIIFIVILIVSIILYNHVSKK